MMSGGWVLAEMKEAHLPENVEAAFKAVTGELIGADYMPVLYCGSQIVNGINYMLICKQTLSDEERTEHLVEMIIYEKPNGGSPEYSLSRITTVL